MHHHLAILDEKGIIIFVNKAWCKFADANGLVWDDYGIGRNYLEVCETAVDDGVNEALAAFEGIHGVITNQQNESSLEYPCHSPNERRWFFMYVFKYEDCRNSCTAVVHMNISGQKLDKKKLQSYHD